MSEQWKDRFLEKIGVKLMDMGVDLEQAFRLFNIDCDDKINADDFRSTVVKMKVMVSDSEIDSFLRESVIKKDGGLDKTQFFSIFQPIMQNLKNGMQRMAINRFKEVCS